MDGAGPLRLFFSVILPLLRPVVITIIVVQAVAIFNDFTGPLYFLPGNENVTVQLTLFNFQSQTLNQWNLLFTNILLITVPPLVMYIFFNRQIVAGMTSGAVRADHYRNLGNSASGSTSPTARPRSSVHTCGRRCSGSPRPRRC